MSRKQKTSRRAAVISLWAIALLLVPAALSGCSSGTKPASSPLSSSTSTPATTSAPGTQTVTVTPSSGLHSGQTVQVRASGFSPEEPLIVIECANKGNATGEGDCDINETGNVTSNSSGQVSTTYSVVKGPFGSNNIVCGATQQCEISVSQLTPNPTQVGTANISFSG